MENEPEVRKRITLTVNGNKVESDIPTRMTLAEFLREELGLTGTKVGCNRGECGSCTVILDGDPAGKSIPEFRIERLHFPHAQNDQLADVMNDPQGEEGPLVQAVKKIGEIRGANRSDGRVLPQFRQCILLFRRSDGKKLQQTFPVENILDILKTEDHQRVADRIDLVLHAEIRGIGQPQNFGGQYWIRENHLGKIGHLYGGIADEFIVGVRSEAHKIALERADGSLKVVVMDWC